MEWMILPLKRYATFSGRAQRKEFWMWVLFLLIVTVILSVIDRMLGLSPAPRPVPPGQFGTGAVGTAQAFRGGGLLTGIFSLAIFLPNLAVQVRRLHDTNRSGWWLLLPVAPYVIGFVIMIGGAVASFRPGQPIQSGAVALIGVGGIFFVIGLIAAILLLVWFCMDGTRGPNRFGDDPKGPQDLREVFR